MFLQNKNEYVMRSDIDSVMGCNVPANHKYVISQGHMVSRLTSF